MDSSDWNLNFSPSAAVWCISLSEWVTRGLLHSCRFTVQASHLLSFLSTFILTFIRTLPASVFNSVYKYKICHCFRVTKPLKQHLHYCRTLNLNLLCNSSSLSTKFWKPLKSLLQHFFHLSRWNILVPGFSFSYSETNCRPPQQMLRNWS